MSEHVVKWLSVRPNCFSMGQLFKEERKECSGNVHAENTAGPFSLIKMTRLNLKGLYSCAC